MKKTLVAIAAVVAATGAMAESTLGGFMQIGINQTKTTAASTTTTTNLEDSNANTQISVTDVEDLGDGMKATFVISLSPGLSYGSTNAATGGGQQTYAALSGAFGEIKVGTFGNDQFWTVVAGDSTGYMGSNAAVINQAYDTLGAGTNWTSKQVRYQLPTIATGLTLAYTAKMAETATTDGTGGAQTLFAGYTTGGFNAQLAATQYKASTGDTDTLTGIAASYDFGVAKLYALSTSAKLGGTVLGDTGSVSGTNFGVSVPLGAFTIMYNKASATGNLYQRNITAVDQSSQDVGVTYAFSKKTTAWVLFTKYNGASGGQGTDTATDGYGYDSLRVMLTHAF